MAAVASSPRTKQQAAARAMASDLESACKAANAARSGFPDPMGVLLTSAVHSLLLLARAMREGRPGAVDSIVAAELARTALVRASVHELSPSERMSELTAALLIGSVAHGRLIGARGRKVGRPKGSEALAKVSALKARQPSLTGAALVSAIECALGRVVDAGSARRWWRQT